MCSLGGFVGSVLTCAGGERLDAGEVRVYGW